jgi:hypothetical protein
VGIQKQIQAWPGLRDAEKDSLEQVQGRMTVMYQLKSRCYPSNQTKWFYPTLEDHIAKAPSLQQQQGWLALYEPMIR